MSFTDFYRNGVNFSHNQYARDHFTPDQAEAVLPTHRFKGEIEKHSVEGKTEAGHIKDVIGTIDGAIHVLSGVGADVRKEKLAAWEKLGAKSALATFGSIVVIAAGAAIASATLPVAMTVLGIALAVSGVALACFSIMRLSESFSQMSKWKDPVDHAAQVRTSIPKMPIKSILPLVGKYIHKDELYRMFFSKVWHANISAENHLNQTQLRSEKIKFVQGYFSDNPLELADEVLGKGNIAFMPFRLVVADKYHPLKQDYDRITKETANKISSIQKEKKYAIFTQKMNEEQVLKPWRANLESLEAEKNKILQDKNKTPEEKNNLVTSLNQKILEAEIKFNKNAHPIRQPINDKINRITDDAERNIKAAKEEEATILLELYSKLSNLTEDLHEAIAKVIKKTAQNSKFAV